MRVFPYAALMASALAGCAAPGPSPQIRLEQASLDLVAGYARSTSAYLQSNSAEAAIESAKESLRNSLKDPDSAQFRNIRIVDYANGKVICGQVNGKNSYGGYVGYRRFVASPMSATVERTGSRYANVDRVANTGLDTACGY